MNKEKLKEIYFKIDNFLKNNILILLLLTVFLFRVDLSRINIRSIAKKLYGSTVNHKNSNIMFDTVAMANEITMDNNKSVVMSKRSPSSVRKTTAVGATISKKIVKNVNLSLEVKNTNNSKIKLENDIEKIGGFIENYYSYDFYNKMAFNFSIKVPAKKLTIFLDTIKKYGEIKNENFSLVDKTEQYNDNENRLKNLYTRRDSLRNMMKMKTNNLGDILAVDRELNSVQYEIERYEKSNQVIDREVEYSTVDLTLTPEVIQQTKIEKWKITKSFKTALLLLLKTLQKIIDWLIVILVFTPMVLCCWWVYTVVKKHKK